MKNRLLQKHIVNGVGVFYYYDSFMISEIDEGVKVELDIVLKISDEFTKKYYSFDNPFVYIANRINSYSLQPTVHFEAKKQLPYVKGYAVVTYDAINTKIATLEQSFLEVPTKVFDNLEDAIFWSDQLLLDK
ncbi:hypothetical protein GBO31_08460 [Aquimarina litoralis]|nr:hypothetical protein [Aquimarina litoralis]